MYCCILSMYWYISSIRCYILPSYCYIFFDILLYFVDIRLYVISVLLCFVEILKYFVPCIAIFFSLVFTYTDFCVSTLKSCMSLKVCAWKHNKMISLPNPVEECSARLSKWTLCQKTISSDSHLNHNDQKQWFH